MTPENYDNNMRFALDTAKKALERIKTQVQELEAAVTIIDTTRFLVATGTTLSATSSVTADAVTPSPQGEGSCEQKGG